MSLLNASRISFSSTGGRTLLRDATFSLHPGDRVGLTAANGAGKSTLLRLLAGDLTPDSGTLVRRRGLAVAALGIVTEQLFQRLPYGRSSASHTEPRASASGPGGVARLFHDEHLWQDHAGVELSGGERVRRELERCLASGAELLLLDEPTIHLDAGSPAWLEDALSACHAALVAVSHERVFLNLFARKIRVLERGSFREYSGNFDACRRERRGEEERQWTEWDAGQRRVRAAQHAVARRETVAARVARTPPGTRHGKDHYARKAGKVMRTARLLRQRAGEAAATPKPWAQQPVPVFDFPWVPRSGDVVPRGADLACAYGDRAVWRGLNLTLRRGERLALAGANGSGKTTLLRLLGGAIAPSAGRLEWGARVRPAYLSQHGEDLDHGRTALDLCREIRADETWIRTLLGCWKMPAERVLRPVSALSAGERNKVALARLLLAEVNLLLLDEPANHLEIESVEALAATLEQFPGAIVFATHDRWLVERLATRTLPLPSEAGRNTC